MFLFLFLPQVCLPVPFSTSSGLAWLGSYTCLGLHRGSCKKALEQQQQQQQQQQKSLVSVLRNRALSPSQSTDSKTTKGSRNTSFFSKSSLYEKAKSLNDLRRASSSDSCASIKVVSFEKPGGGQGSRGREGREPGGQGARGRASWADLGYCSSAGSRRGSGSGSGRRGSGGSGGQGEDRSPEGRGQDYKQVINSPCFQTIKIMPLTCEKNAV